MAAIGSLRAEAERRKRFDVRAALDEIEAIHRAQLVRIVREDAARIAELEAELKHFKRLIRVSWECLSDSQRAKIAAWTA